MSFRNAIVVGLIFGALGGELAVAGERSVKVSAADKAACMPDARRLCRDALPNVRRVVMCFLGQKSKLSNPCRAVLASYGL